MEIWFCIWDDLANPTAQIYQLNDSGFIIRAHNSEQLSLVLVCNEDLLSFKYKTERLQRGSLKNTSHHSDISTQRSRENVFRAHNSEQLCRVTE